ncbi:unnamed protein product [Pleuronectes platessa]|uniref:Uncharacterized protein n=1 Tax=Pleuronectes platessa TaxID=8262 RepID=A0A9N7ZDZ8_PLEPL|nr:unnamed protein product [Pleuronectes platessa]
MNNKPPAHHCCLPSPTPGNPPRYFTLSAEGLLGSHCMSAWRLASCHQPSWEVERGAVVEEESLRELLFDNVHQESPRADQRTGTREPSLSDFKRSHSETDTTPVSEIESR